MKQTLPLARWLTAPRPDDTPIAWLDESSWTLGDLRHDVALTILSAIAQINWPGTHAIYYSMI